MDMVGIGCLGAWWLRDSSIFLFVDFVWFLITSVKR